MLDMDVKLVLLGGQGSGKSALLQRLVNKHFRPDLPPTFAPAFGATRVTVSLPGTADGGGVSGARRRSGSGSGSGRAPTFTSAVVGVWDTAGSPRLRGMSRSYIEGADAVLVCWDPTSRASWDALRAWVQDAQAVEPRAGVYVAACKADLLATRRQGSPLPHMEVEVERWRPQQAQQAQHHGDEALGKPPLAGGGGGAERAPAPATPSKAAECPASRSEQAAGDEGPPPAVGSSHAARAAAAAGRHVIAQHEQAAAAEVVSALTGPALPSPFAAVAARPLSPDAAATPGSASSEGGSHPSRRSSPSSRPPSSSPDAAAGVHWREDTEQLERAQRPRRSKEPPAPAPPLQAPAVPASVAEHYCASVGARLFHLSARTGEGVADMVQLIAQEVIEQRLRQRLQQQQQQREQQQQRRGMLSPRHGSAPGLHPHPSPIAAATQGPRPSSSQQQQQQQQRQQQQQQWPRALSAGDTLPQTAAEPAAERHGSRGRSGRQAGGGGRARITSVAAGDGDSSSRGGRGEAGREYVVGAQELRSWQQVPLQDPSCRIS